MWDLIGPIDVEDETDDAVDIEDADELNYYWEMLFW